MMLFKLYFISIICIYSSQCQNNPPNILQIMQNDSRITQFYKAVLNNPSVLQYFNNPALTIFVPSDVAFNSTNLASANITLLLQSHMFESRTTSQPYSILGVTSNWTMYSPVTARNFTMYYMKSIGSTNHLYMYSISGATTTYYCNEAMVVAPNIPFDQQVYHIVDRVLINYQWKSFFNYLQTNANLKTTYSYWNILNNAALVNKLPPNSNFTSAFLTFDLTYPVTILLPTNAAWDKLGVSLTNNLTSLVNLVPVMARYYIPDNIYFLRGQTFNFSVGFNPAPRQNSDGLAQGLITGDLQVNVQNYTARVVMANIPIRYGVLHIIDDPLVVMSMVPTYLAAYANVFLTAVTANPILAPYLNSSTYTIVAIDDIIMGQISGLPNLQEILTNCFIQGRVNLTTNGTYVTAGNLTFRVRTSGTVYYLDVQSPTPADNTWIRTVQVISLNQMVGSGFINKINGTLQAVPQDCPTTMLLLNHTIYPVQLASLSIALNMGSPYTMLVPNDVSLSAFLAPSSGTPPSTTTIKYVIQRMIIPNRLIFAQRSSATFNVATMNYAAMGELLSMTISPPNSTIGIYGVYQTFTYARGGYYCFSNTVNDPTRYNLIYPVGFVLVTPTDQTITLCVTPPCSACRNSLNILLVLAISCVMVVIKQNLFI